MTCQTICFITNIFCWKREGGPSLDGRQYNGLGSTENLCSNDVNPWSDWDDILWYIIILIYHFNHSCNLL